MNFRYTVYFILFKDNLSITTKALYAMNDFFLKMKYIEIVRLAIKSNYLNCKTKDYRMLSKECLLFWKGKNGVREQKNLLKQSIRLIHFIHSKFSGFKYALRDTSTIYFKMGSSYFMLSSLGVFLKAYVLIIIYSATLRFMSI